MNLPIELSGWRELNSTTLIRDPAGGLARRGGKSMKAGFVSLIVGAIGLAMPAQAHHSFSASYVMNDEMSIEGDVVAFQFRNPHVLIIMSSFRVTRVVRQRITGYVYATFDG